MAAARRRLWPLALVMVEIASSRGSGRGSSPCCCARRSGKPTSPAGSARPPSPCSLEDTGETGGVWTAERIQIAVAKERDAAIAGTDIRVAAGVASYPNHALKADQLTGGGASPPWPGPGASAPPDHGLGAVEVARADLS